MRRFGLGLAAAAAAALFAIPPAWGGTLDTVRARGKLVCGVSEGLPGFSDRDSAGAWAGFDVDFCRAVAAAIFADPEKVDYVPLSATARFDALKGGEIDLLSRNSTWTMSRDVGLGIDFAGISYYDGQGFLSRAAYGVTSALELQGARICVITGTTTEENAAAYFAEQEDRRHLHALRYPAAARKAYAEEACDVFTADRSALAAERSLLATPDEHVILPEVISKEPLGPVTREDDPAWTGPRALDPLRSHQCRGARPDRRRPRPSAAGRRQAEGRSARPRHSRPPVRLHLADDWLAPSLVGASATTARSSIAISATTRRSASNAASTRRGTTAAFSTPRRCNEDRAHVSTARP